MWFNYFHAIPLFIIKVAIDIDQSVATIKFWLLTPTSVLSKMPIGGRNWHHRWPLYWPLEININYHHYYSIPVQQIPGSSKLSAFSPHHTIIALRIEINVWPHKTRITTFIHQLRCTRLQIYCMVQPFNYYSQTLWKDGRTFCAIDLSDHELTWSHVSVNRHFHYGLSTDWCQ